MGKPASARRSKNCLCLLAKRFAFFFALLTFGCRFLVPLAFEWFFSHVDGGELGFDVSQLRSQHLEATLRPLVETFDVVGVVNR